MYLPEHFSETRLEVLHGLVRARPLATLVAVQGQALVANHLPLDLDVLPTPFGSLRGHVARGNPLWREYRAGSDVLAIFQGPQAYISPSFYPSKALSGAVVPTWDYAVVQAHGTLRFSEDADWLHALVVKLTDTQESTRPQPWAVDDAPAPFVKKMLGAIVGFEFAITSLTGKWKVSQNQKPVDQAGVIRGLVEQGDPDGREIAQMLAARAK